MQSLGVVTIDDMLDVVLEDLDELCLKPVQSRRLQRAIKERRLKRAIEDIDVDDSRQVYSDTKYGRSSEGASQHRTASPDAAESITAAVRALQRAQACRAERTVSNGTSASTAWEQSSTQSSPPTRMDAGEYVDPVAATWADSIMGEERDAVAGPAQCEIGVVDRLFCEVKPLPAQRAKRDDGVELYDEWSSQLLASPPTLPQTTAQKYRSAASRMYAQMPEHLTSSIGSAHADAPKFDRRVVHNGSLSSSKGSIRRKFVIGPGIHLRDGVDDDVIAALASVTSRALSPNGDARAASALGRHHFGVGRNVGSPGTPSSLSSTGSSLSRRGSPSSGTISRHGPIVTPTASALERLLNSVH